MYVRIASDDDGPVAGVGLDVRDELGDLRVAGRDVAWSSASIHVQIVDVDLDGLGDGVRRCVEAFDGEAVGAAVDRAVALRPRDAIERREGELGKFVEPVAELERARIGCGVRIARDRGPGRERREGAARGQVASQRARWPV